MKKLLAILLAVCLLAGLATGCASGAGDNNVTASPDETSSGTSPTDAAETEISGKLVVWEHTGQFEDALKAVIAGYNELYPDVEVEYSVKTSDQYYNLLQAAMQAGECPDVFWTNGMLTTNYESYAEQGMLEELTDVVDFSLYDGTQAMSIVTLPDGSIYSTPTAEIGGRACFYNVDMFDENGWAVPTTFDEFEALLGTINDAGIIPMAYGTSDPWNCLFFFEPIMEGLYPDYLEEYYAEGYVDVGDQRVIDTYNKILEWGDAGYYGAGYTGVSGEGMLLSFASGEAAMCLTGTWNISTISQNNPDLNYSAFMIPTNDGERPFVSTSSCGLAVSSQTQNYDAAIAFVQFFATEAGQSAWLGALGSISCVSSIESDSQVVNAIQNGFDMQVESFYNILGYEAGTGDNPCNVWEEDQTKIFTGGMTVEEFVGELQALCLTKDEYMAAKG